MAKSSQHRGIRGVCIVICAAALALTIIYGLSAQAGIKLGASPVVSLPDAPGPGLGAKLAVGKDPAAEPIPKPNPQKHFSMIAEPLRPATVDPGLPGPNQIMVRRPQGPPTIELSQRDPQGRVGRVTCSTCHSTRAPDPKNRTAAQLDDFHQGMTFAHGKLTCYSCHNPDQMDTLRLADERVVEYADVMELCAQCHGKKFGEYERGIHGGMTGYWDLSRGGRVRNNCIDCHDPHVPKFPMMQPTFKPIERFATPSHDAHHRDGAHAIELNTEPQRQHD